MSLSNSWKVRPPRTDKETRGWIKAIATLSSSKQLLVDHKGWTCNQAFISALEGRPLFYMSSSAQLCDPPAWERIARPVCLNWDSLTFLCVTLQIKVCPTFTPVSVSHIKLSHSLQSQILMLPLKSNFTPIKSCNNRMCNPVLQSSSILPAALTMWYKFNQLSMTIMKAMSCFIEDKVIQCEEIKQNKSTHWKTNVENKHQNMLKSMKKEKQSRNKTFIIKIIKTCTIPASPHCVLDYV